jgi:integrase
LADVDAPPYKTTEDGMTKSATYGEGSVDEYRQGAWRIRYTMGDGTRRSKSGFSSEREASKALRAVLTDIERGDYFDEAKGQILFREFAAQYLEVRQGDVSPGTFRNWRSLLNSTLLPTFGHKRLSEISVRLVEVWWARSAGHKVNRRNAYFLLSPMMTKAVRWGYLRTSPCQIDEPGKDVAVRRPTYSVDDMRAVIAHSPDWLVSIIWVTFSAHLRIGELCGLNRGDYDTSTKTLVIERQLSGVTHELAQTKTGNRRRTELLQPGWEALDAHLVERPMLPSAPLFASASGRRISASVVRRALEKAAVAAGFEDFHLHDLKAIGLTLVAQTGADTRDIMERGGHTSTAAALRYQHSDAVRQSELTAKANARLLA